MQEHAKKQEEQEKFEIRKKNTHTHTYTLIGSSQTWLFKPGCLQFKPGCLQFLFFALFCTLLRPSALFCGLAFAVFCAHLHVSANDRVENDRGWEHQN